MKQKASFETGLLLGMLLNQNALQQQLIEVQQENIRLRKQIEEQTPRTPPVEEIRWHMVSKGASIDDALSSEDVAVVRMFYEWLLGFGNKHLKPYLNYRVYSELMNLLTHSATRRLADLEASAGSKSGDLVQLTFVGPEDTKPSPKTIKLKQTPLTSSCAKKEKVSAAH